MNISAPFIQRPVATTLLTIAIALAGILGYIEPAGGAAAAGGFPDHFRAGAIARRQSGRRGDQSRRAARTPPRTDRRRHGDDLAKPDRAVARIMLQFGLDRNINGAAKDVQAAINAAQADLPTNLLSQADLSQGESGRRAGAHPGPDIARRSRACQMYDAASNCCHSSCRRFRRGRGFRRRLGAASRAGGARSGQAVPLRHRTRRCPLGALQRQRQRAQGRHRDRRASLADLHHRPGLQAVQYRDSGHRLSQRRRAATARRRRGGRFGQDLRNLGLADGGRR